MRERDLGRGAGPRTAPRRGFRQALSGVDMPPTRWRVVERGRRLEVIDTLTGVAPAPRRPPADRQAAPGWLPRQTRFDGTAEWTTHRLYDDKAPRTIALAPGRAALLGWGRVALAVLALALVVIVARAPWLLAAAGALANPKVRSRLRGWTTQTIDRLEAAPL